MHFQTSSFAATLALASTTFAIAIPGMTMDERYLARRALKTGLGTRYGGGCKEEDCWQNGACAFTDYELPAGIDGSTCVSEDIWENGAQCGGCISVTYKGKTLTIMVTNKTGGDKNHLDMTPATWSKLTNGMTGGGVDGIQWDFVKCPITNPLSIHMHAGSSRYWFAATVENATYRTSKLEVSTDQGSTWQPTTRNVNNFFEASGALSADTAWVKVTSVEGSSVVVKDVKLVPKSSTAATENYADGSTPADEQQASTAAVDQKQICDSSNEEDQDEDDDC